MKVPSLQLCLFKSAQFESLTVSMIDGELFDKLARIGSLLRRKSEPFGGIQVSSFLCSTLMFIPELL